MHYVLQNALQDFKMMFTTHLCCVQLAETIQILWLYHKYVSNNALVYVSLFIITHIVYCSFVLYSLYHSQTKKGIENRFQMLFILTSNWVLVQSKSWWVILFHVFNCFSSFQTKKMEKMNGKQCQVQASCHRSRGPNTGGNSGGRRITIKNVSSDWELTPKPS